MVRLERTATLVVCLNIIGVDCDVDAANEYECPTYLLLESSRHYIIYHGTVHHSKMVGRILKVLVAEPTRITNTESKLVHFYG